MKLPNRRELCLLYNFAQHYRTEIFRLMDRELGCDFVFGDRYLDVRKMDYSLLRNVREVRNRRLFGACYYQPGAVSLVRTYRKIFALADPYCVSTWMILFLAPFYGTKVYLWTHGMYGKEGRLRTGIMRLACLLSKGVFLYGNRARELMMAKGVDGRKLHVIYNSLAYDVQRALRERLKPQPLFADRFRNDDPNLIFVGRLTGVKRLDMLLAAVERLNGRGRPVNLTLIGEGACREELAAQACRLGIADRVWFFGPCYDERRLSELIYNADLCVSPGNVGLTAVHALMFGTPVITHDDFAYQMPEFEAVESGKTGAFFAHGDVASLSDTIERWLAAGRNRERIRTACYNMIDTHYNPHCQIEVMRRYLE